MRVERSAGFVVFTEQSAASKSNGRLYLLLDYGQHWDYPKGHVEKGEVDSVAALRELHEETGIDDVQIIPGFMRRIVYFFRAAQGDSQDDSKTGSKSGKPGKSAKTELVKKEVVFFLGRAAGEKVRLSEEHCNSAYLPFEEALKRLTFANAREVLRAAEQFLETRQ
jgi:8-oxo-dGTP pyrophosphatase MutT (NUDIX family)